MTDHRATVRIVREERITSNAHANDVLDDAPYLAFCLIQACRLLIALIGKRWPALK